MSEVPIRGRQPRHSKMTGTPAIAVGVMRAAVLASWSVSWLTVHKTTPSVGIYLYSEVSVSKRNA